MSKKMILIAEKDENDKMRVSFEGTVDFAMQAFVMCIARSMYSFYGFGERTDGKYSPDDFFEQIGPSMYGLILPTVERMFEEAGKVFDGNEEESEEEKDD